MELDLAVLYESQKVRRSFCKISDFLIPRENTEMIVVGVDGGATKTSAVVIKVDDVSSAQPTRIVVGRSVSGSTNRNSVGNAAAVAAMHEVITSALRVRFETVSKT